MKKIGLVMLYSFTLCLINSPSFAGDIEVIQEERNPEAEDAALLKQQNNNQQKLPPASAQEKKDNQPEPVTVPTGHSNSHPLPANETETTSIDKHAAHAKEVKAEESPSELSENKTPKRLVTETPQTPQKQNHGNGFLWFAGVFTILIIVIFLLT